MGRCRSQPEYQVNIIYQFKYKYPYILCREKVYGFKTQTAADHHIEQLHKLSNIILLWPPIDEMIAASRKVDEVILLDKISREITHTIRPVTEVISKTLNHPPPGKVFKREVSDTSSHVLLPEKIAKLSRKELKKIALDKFRWMSQTFIPQLIQFGEWRVYFVGGRYHSVVITEPTLDKMHCEIMDGMWSLKELRCISGQV